MDVIDFRVMPPISGYRRRELFERDLGERIHLLRALFDPAEGLAPSVAAHSVELLIEEMDAAGVTRAVVAANTFPLATRAAVGEGDVREAVTNEQIATFVRRSPKRFSGIGSVSAYDPDAASVVDTIASLGFRGTIVNMRILWEDPVADDDPRTMRVLEACHERGLFVVFVRSIAMGPPEFIQPWAIMRAALALPDLQIVVGHGSWPFSRELMSVLARCPNVSAMPDVYMNTPGIPGAGDYIDAITCGLDDQIIYGSSYPVRPVGESAAFVRAIECIRPESLQKIMFGNAARLLGLPVR